MTSENRNSTRDIFSAWLGRGLFHLCSRSCLKQKLSVTSRDCEIGVTGLKITQVGRNLRRSPSSVCSRTVCLTQVIVACTDLFAQAQLCVCVYFHNIDSSTIGCCLRVRCYPSSIRQWNKILPLLFQVGADRGTNINSLKAGLPLRQLLIFQRGSAKVWWSVSTLNWADVG